MRLLFVCTGNTCRSPLAAAAWRAFGAPLLAENKIESSASSAGLSASSGAPAAGHSIAVAKEWGQDIAKHRARRVTLELVREADLLVALTAHHAVALRSRFPQHKVLQLGAFAGDSAEPSAALSELQQLFGEEPGDILDPIGGSLEAYQECGAHIRRAVEGLAAALRDGKVLK